MQAEAVPGYVAGSQTTHDLLGYEGNLKNYPKSHHLRILVQLVRSPGGRRINRPPVFIYLLTQ